MKGWFRSVTGLCGLLCMGSVLAQEVLPFKAQRPLLASPTVSRLIVQYRQLPGGTSRSALHLNSLSRTALLPLSYHHAITENMHVLALPREMTATEARLVAQRLAHDPNVLSAAPDDRMKLYTVAGAAGGGSVLASGSLHLDALPNDPLFSKQWALTNPVAGINIESAWAITQGDPRIVTAVLDSGVLEMHPDLKGRLLPGFNFISDPVAAGNGVGRSASPADTGDFCADGNPNDAMDSDWHGSHVAGIIGARAGNGIGTAGINPRSMILPVRVIGRCGGAESDTLAGILWAVGLPVAGAPANPHPARVLNLSLGAANNGPCPQEVQRVIDEAYARNAAIVVAAGNDNIDASQRMPANCQHVITVAAVKADAARPLPADWLFGQGSNFGNSITISAPGDQILSSVNSGLTTPAQNTWGFLSGTSQATPQVAGVLSLMLSVNPRLTPDQLKALLIQSRRPFPAGARCQGICQAGLLDAGRAVHLAALTVSTAASGTKPAATRGHLAVSAGPSLTARAGARVTLQGSASAPAPAFIRSLAWQQVSGVRVVLSNSHLARPVFVAPRQPGQLVFRLTATDSQGHSLASSTQVVVVAAATQ